MDAALHALADPRRRAILALVRDRELPAGDIAARFDVTRPAGAAELRMWLEAFWEDNLARLKAAAEQEERTDYGGERGR